MIDPLQMRSWRMSWLVYWTVLLLTLATFLFVVLLIPTEQVRIPLAVRWGSGALFVALMLALLANTYWCLDCFKRTSDATSARRVMKRLWIPLLLADGLLTLVVCSGDLVWRNLRRTPGVRLTIRSTDPEAILWVNGREMGKAPLTLEQKDLLKALQSGLAPSWPPPGCWNGTCTYANTRSRTSVSIACSDLVCALQIRFPGLSAQGGLQIRAVNPQGMHAKVLGKDLAMETTFDSETYVLDLLCSGFDRP